VVGMAAGACLLLAWPAIGHAEPEVCNGKDDDGDGMTDEGAPCPTEHACRFGACVPACARRDFPCPPGQRCDDGYCVPNCAGITCDGGVCDPKNGTCRRACELDDAGCAPDQPPEGLDASVGDGAADGAGSDGGLAPRGGGGCGCRVGDDGLGAGFTLLAFATLGRLSRRNRARRRHP